MDVAGVLRIALSAVAILLACFGIWAVVEIVGAARSVRALSDRLTSDLPPLIVRANATLDAVNDGIERVDGVVTQIGEVSERASSTAKAAQDMVDAPMAAVSSMAEGARRFASVLFGRRP
jgi:acyl-coenzyme A synthetase/AMP-(fatty) acid ligase